MRKNISLISLGLNLYIFGLGVIWFYSGTEELSRFSPLVMYCSAVWFLYELLDIE